MYFYYIELVCYIRNICGVLHIENESLVFGSLLF